MKNRIAVALCLSASALVVAVLLVGCASGPSANLHTDAPEEKTRVEQRLKEIFDAAEKKDLNRLDSYHFSGPKFTKFSGSSPTRQDAEAGRKGEHTGLAAISGLRMQAADLKVDVFGNVAIATFILSSSFKSGADTVVKNDRSTLVFVKDGEAWKITHEHFSPIAAAP